MLGLGSDHPVEAVCVPARQIGTSATSARSGNDQQRQEDWNCAVSRCGENLPALKSRHADVGALLQEKQGGTCLPEQPMAQEWDFAQGRRLLSQPCVGKEVQIGDRAHVCVNLVLDFRSGQERERYGDHDYGL